MPLKRTIEKARKDRRQGKSPSTQAGEFVREEIDNIRRGEHGARSTKQAIAIGLSEARRAGVKLPPPKRGQVTERTRKGAEYAYEAGQGKRKTRRRPRVSRAVSQALVREPHNTVSRKALLSRARPCRAKPTAPLAVAPRRSAPPPPARRRAPRGRSAARPRQKRRRGPGRAGKAKRRGRTPGDPL